MKNFLLTGRPGSGKSTIIQQLVANLKKQGVKVGGLLCPEIRGPSGRLGFKIIELMSGEERILAYVGQTGPKVGKYGVNLNNLDEMSRKALETLPQAEVVVIDEIGPMEVRSSLFCDFVRKCLDSNKPVLSAIHKRTESGLIGEIKRRKDVMIFEITPEKRKEILEELREKVEALLNLQR